VQLSDATPDGVWSSSDPAVATVSTTGITAGVIAGIVIARYAVSDGTCANEASLSLTVASPPLVAAITGGSSICGGSQLQLSCATPGVVWSSSDPTVATVDQSTGLVSSSWGLPSPGHTTLSAHVTDPDTQCGSASVQEITATQTVTPSVSISLDAGSSNPTCSGTPVTFHATPVGGGTAPEFNWTKGGGASVGFTDTFTDAGLTGGDVRCTLTSSETCATSSSVESNPITLEVTAPVTPTASLAITSGTNPTCHGVPVTFTATTTNYGGGTPHYTWTSESNGVVSNVGTDSPEYTVDALTDGVLVIRYLFGLTGTACTTTTSVSSDPITMEVIPTIVPTVAIAITSGSNPTCHGTPVTFTATPTYSCGTPHYQWMQSINGAPEVQVGTDSPEYTVPALTDGLLILRAMLGLTGTALTNGAIGSNTITLGVTAPVTPTVSLAMTSGTDPTCHGTPVSFTATPTNGGSTPLYSFSVEVAGVSVGGIHHCRSAVHPRCLDRRLADHPLRDDDLGDLCDYKRSCSEQRRPDNRTTVVGLVC